MDRGAWWATVHGVAKSQTRLSNFTFTFRFHALEETYGHGERGGEGEMYGKSNMETYITLYKIDSQQEFSVWLRKLKQGL